MQTPNRETGLQLPGPEQTQEPVYYMEAANGMTVRVPASRLEAWEAEQDKIRRGEVTGLTPEEKASVERILSRIFGDQRKP